MVRNPFLTKTTILRKVSEHTGITLRNLYKYAEEVEMESKLFIKDKDIYEALTDLMNVVSETERYLWKDIQSGNSRLRLNAIRILVKNRFMLFSTLMKSGLLPFVAGNSRKGADLYDPDSSIENLYRLRDYVEQRLKEIGLVIKS